MHALPRKRNRLTGHLFFLVLFILAVVFYRERILYADSAFYVFKIINFSKFNIEAGRFGSFLTQILPLMAIRQGLPLRIVIISYSVSFVLVYYIVYLVSVYVLRSNAAALIICLVLVLGIRHSFYHTVTETHQGLVYCVLLFAWLNYPLQMKSKELQQPIHMAVSVLIIMLCYFVHPVTLFPVLFIIGYRIIEKDDWRNYGLYVLIAITVTIFTAKFLTTDNQSYEGQIFASFASALDALGNLFHLYSFKFFIKRIGGQYFFLVIMALSIAVYYIARKSYTKLAYYLLAGSGIFIITILTYSLGDSDMAMERAFMPLGIFIVVPFVNEFVLAYKKTEMLVFSFLIITLGVSLAGIIRTGNIYRERTAYIDELLVSTEHLEGSKFIIEKADADMSKIIVPWAIGAETLLYSSLDSPDDARTIYMVDDLDNFNYNREQVDLYMCVSFWRDWDSASLNKSYFRLQGGSYVPLVLQ